MNKLLKLNLDSDLAYYSVVVCVAVFIFFLIVYSYKAYKNLWTIRQSSQYFILVFIPVLSFSVTMIINVFLSFVFDVFLIICIKLNENNRYNEYSDLEKQGITAILERYQGEQKVKFMALNDTEKKAWIEKNCRNPIKINVLAAILIVYIPFVIALILRIIF